MPAIMQVCTALKMKLLVAAVAPPSIRVAPMALRMQSPTTLTITLVGCANGVGVGLNADNEVDMLADGSPAAADLFIGDKILQWGDVAMIDPESGQQRLLKDVVSPADTHTLIIERTQPSSAPSPPKAPSDATKSSPAAWTAQETWSDDAWVGTEAWDSGSKWG